MLARITRMGSPENAEIARLLERIAALLELRGANSYRVSAWRRGAEVCRHHPDSIARLATSEGRPGLELLPGIGPTIAGQILLWARTGSSPYLDRLERDASPESAFQTLPGVGPALARRLHDSLAVETLEELEVAAHNGRLEGVPGIGPRRAAAIRDVLALRLARTPREPVARHEPSVELLLRVDAEYRERSRLGQLKKIAPRRFNPTCATWLPIWHCDRDGWRLTVLFSNTALAHRLGRTQDWVVIYAKRGDTELQYTVVTEKVGPREGARVVRGRESESSSGRNPQPLTRLQ